MAQRKPTITVTHFDDLLSPVSLNTSWNNYCWVINSNSATCVAGVGEEFETHNQITALDNSGRYAWHYIAPPVPQGLSVFMGFWAVLLEAQTLMCERTLARSLRSNSSQKRSIRLRPLKFFHIKLCFYIIIFVCSSTSLPTVRMQRMQFYTPSAFAGWSMHKQTDFVRLLFISPECWQNQRYVVWSSEQRNAGRWYHTGCWLIQTSWYLIGISTLHIILDNKAQMYIFCID